MNVYFKNQKEDVSQFKGRIAKSETGTLCKKDILVTN